MSQRIYFLGCLFTIFILFVSVLLFIFNTRPAKKQVQTALNIPIPIQTSVPNNQVKKIKVEVLNGSGITGLAKQRSLDISNEEFEIVKIDTNEVKVRTNELYINKKLESEKDFILSLFNRYNFSLEYKGTYDINSESDIKIIFAN